MYYELGSSIVAVSIEARGKSLTAGMPEMLFNGPFDLRTTDFAIAPDGAHFIMVESDPNARPTQIQVALNWAEEVKRLATPRQR